VEVKYAAKNTKAAQASASEEVGGWLGGAQILCRIQSDIATAKE
jgi:hypothetical protein